MRHGTSTTALALALGLALGTAAATDNDRVPSMPHRGGGGGSMRIVAAASIEDLLRQRAPPHPRDIRTVTNCADDGSAGSLRSVVASAVDGDLVDLSHLTCSSITLDSGAIAMPQGSLTLQGPGAASLMLYGGGDRVLLHTGTGTLNIYDLTLSDGFLQNASAGGCVYSAGDVYLKDARLSYCAIHSPENTASYGGALFARGALSMQRSTIEQSEVIATYGRAFGGGAYVYGGLVMRDSTIRDNIVESYGAGDTFGYGGGAFVRGPAVLLRALIANNSAGASNSPYHGNVGAMSLIGETQILDSTISGNSASDLLGAIYAAAPLTLANSTVAFNEADLSTSSYAGGVHVYATTADLESSIIAGNTAGGAPSDLNGYAATISGANDLIVASALPPPAGTITSDPMLGPLLDNGGPTLTHALDPLSPAIDHGNNVQALDFDQRGDGFPRTSGAATDIGAFELQAVDDTIFASGFDPPDVVP